MKFNKIEQNLHNTIIDGHWAPILLKQMVYFYPGDDSATWWCRQQIKKESMADPHKSTKWQSDH